MSQLPSSGKPTVTFRDEQGVLDNIERVGKAPHYRYIIRCNHKIVYKENLQEALVIARQLLTEEENTKRIRIFEKELGKLDYDIYEKSNAVDIFFKVAADKTNAVVALDNHTMKKILRRNIEDPWRKVGGKTVLVEADSRFIRSGGRILQNTGGGVLFLDFLGQNCFVKNYPYRYPDETMISFSAIPSDSYSYTDVLGASRTVRSFDYCTPCQRPANANEIEAEALKITPIEELRIRKAGEQAMAEISKAQLKLEAANKNKQDFLQKSMQQIEDEKNAIQNEKALKLQAIQNEKNLKIKSEQARILKNLQELADKGDTYGLLYMGERYRDGNGVPKDLVKARDYFMKSAAAGSPSAAEALKKLPAN